MLFSIFAIHSRVIDALNIALVKDHQSESKRGLICVWGTQIKPRFPLTGSKWFS